MKSIDTNFITFLPELVSQMVFDTPLISSHIDMAPPFPTPIQRNR